MPFVKNPNGGPDIWDPGSPENSYKPNMFENLQQGILGTNTQPQHYPTMSTARPDEERALGLEARGMQGEYAALLRAQLAGKGPSVAQMQLAQGRDAAIRGATSAAASARGSNVALAGRTAGQTAGRVGMQAARDSALIRAQEQLAAQQQFGSLAGAMRGQDLQARQISSAEEQARLNSQIAYMNAQTQISEGEAARRQKGYGAGLMALGGLFGSDVSMKNNMQPVGNGYQPVGNTPAFQPAYSPQQYAALTATQSGQQSLMGMTPPGQGGPTDPYAIDRQMMQAQLSQSQGWASPAKGPGAQEEGGFGAGLTSFGQGLTGGGVPSDPLVKARMIALGYDAGTAEQVSRAAYNSQQEANARAGKPPSTPAPQQNFDVSQTPAAQPAYSPQGFAADVKASPGQIIRDNPYPPQKYGSSQGPREVDEGAPEFLPDAPGPRQAHPEYDQASPESPQARPDFNTWYGGHAQRFGLNPNPDDPRHQYDYRGAYDAGVEPDASGHFDSRFKGENHPNRFVNGEDTRGSGPPPKSPPTARFPDLVQAAAQVQPYGFEYTPEGAQASGTSTQPRVGVAANRAPGNLEQNPVFAPTVQYGPDGLARVNGGQLAATTAATGAATAREVIAQRQELDALKNVVLGADMQSDRGLPQGMKKGVPASKEASQPRAEDETSRAMREEADPRRGYYADLQKAHLAKTKQRGDVVVPSGAALSAERTGDAFLAAQPRIRSSRSEFSGESRGGDTTPYMSEGVETTVGNVVEGQAGYLNMMPQKAVGPRAEVIRKAARAMNAENYDVVDKTGKKRIGTSGQGPGVPSAALVRARLKAAGVKNITENEIKHALTEVSL